MELFNVLNLHFVHSDEVHGVEEDSDDLGCHTDSLVEKSRRLVAEL